MFKPNKNVLAPSDPTEKLRDLPLVGETVRLPNGAIFQKPHPDMIRALQALDPRVRYFPTDFEKASKADASYSYYRGVTDLLPAQILRDFPGDRLRTSHRGTVVSLRDEFPHFPSRQFPSSDGDELQQMNNVLTILRTGTDRGGAIGMLGAINADMELNNHTEDWLMMHTGGEIDVLLAEGEGDRADNLFPGLLVYEYDMLAHGPDGNIKDPNALAAIYITDRRLREEQFRDLPSATQVLGATALGRV